MNVVISARDLNARMLDMPVKARTGLALYTGKVFRFSPTLTLYLYPKTNSCYEPDGGQ
jgi:hypothetical protein